VLLNGHLEDKSSKIDTDPRSMPAFPAVLVDSPKPMNRLGQLQISRATPSRRSSICSCRRSRPQRTLPGSLTCRSESFTRSIRGRNRTCCLAEPQDSEALLQAFGVQPVVNPGVSGRHDEAVQAVWIRQRLCGVVRGQAVGVVECAPQRKWRVAWPERRASTIQHPATIEPRVAECMTRR
jgi:hypothetical protein